MAEKRPRKTRKKKPAPTAARGLEAPELADGAPPAAVERLRQAITADGGSVLATYRDPLGSQWQILAGLPLALVEPTPYQRDLSDTHVKRLAEALNKLDRFLDPVIAVRTDDGRYWTPNGSHRLGALRALGARAVTALVVLDPEVAYRILVLNTEKAHNVREKALEVSRLEHGLAELDDRPEKDFETEFEDAALLTLGLCYQQNGRFSGGAYHPVLKRIDGFLSAKLSQALAIRRARAARVIALDEAVAAAVAQLKARGFQSPYLKNFVVARINPLRFKRGARADFEDTVDAMLAAVQKLDVTKVRADQLAAAAGPPDD